MAQCPTVIPPPPGVAPPSAAVASTLAFLDGVIQTALANMEADLPRNPRYAQQFRDKIALLSCPTLAQDIRTSRNYFEGGVTSTDGRSIPFVTVFPANQLRDEATQAVHALEGDLAALENFIGIPFPPSIVRIWYGFVIGSSGGGGTLNVEELATFQARVPSVPHGSILAHELSHTYIAHESLTQFLELYVYNVTATGSTSVDQWIFLRDPSFQGVQALLSVYQLLGPSSMGSAYRAVYPLHPPYGQVLSAEARHIFVDQASPDSREQVAQSMAQITY